MRDSAPIIDVVPEFGFWPYITKQTSFGFRYSISSIAFLSEILKASQSKISTLQDRDNDFANNNDQVGGSIAEYVSASF